MALLFMDSFDHYATADVLEKWSSQGASGTGVSTSIGATSGRRGSGSFRVVTGTSTNAQGYVAKAPAITDPTTCILGFALSIPSGTVGAQGWQIASVWDISTVQVCLVVTSAYTVTVQRGPTPTGTVLGTTSATLSTSAFTYIELKVVIHPSAGSIDLRFNGVSVLTLTGVNTRQSANAAWTFVGLGAINNHTSSTSGSSRSVDFDDVYLLDGSGAAPWNAPLGDCRVDARVPTGAGASAAWTPSAGSNWQAVDDATPNDDTDYTTTGTVGAIDTFVVQDAPVAGATIYGVQHCLSLRKTDVGVCTVAPVVRHSGVNYVGATVSPGTTYGYGLVCQATNPATSAAWTEAGFNAAEFGYQRTA